MINALLDILTWFLDTFIPSVTFPSVDFDGISTVIKESLYYPVKILGFANLAIFFTLLNLDWVLTLTLGVAKTILRFIRGMK